jgi:hypothetical protein
MYICICMYDVCMYVFANPIKVENKIFLFEPNRRLADQNKIPFPIASSPVLPDGTYIFKPKMPTWINFGRSRNERCWHILCTCYPFYCQMVSFGGIRLILWSLGIFSPLWYVVPRQIRQPWMIAAANKVVRKNSNGPAGHAQKASAICHGEKRLRAQDLSIDLLPRKKTFHGILPS